MTRRRNHALRLANNGRPIRDDGFTLVEVLVALTILGLSVAVLFAIFSQGLERTREDRRAMEARVFAQSLLTRVEAAPPITDSRGTEQSGLTWQIHVEPADETGRKQTGLSAELVSVSVRWSVGEQGKSLRLATLAIAPKEARP